MKSVGTAACNYDDLLKTFEHEILLKKDQGDYQGDSWVLFKDSIGRYGYLQFGWGSCSGCDALEACNSVQEVDELRDSLANDIKWFDHADGMMDFLVGHDWEGDYSGRITECIEFVAEARELMATVLHKLGEWR